MQRDDGEETTRKEIGAAFHVAGEGVRLESLIIYMEFIFLKYFVKKLSPLYNGMIV